MGWRVARSLIVLRDQANDAWPGRNRAADGTIGDAAHSSRTSDHNPNAAGVVCALDLTHDPANGADMNRLAELIKSDPRVKYLIWNRRIWNPSVSRSWRHYSGSNPHTAHMHISVSSPARIYDSTAPWNVAGTSRPDPSPEQEDDETMRYDEKSKRVEEWQHALNLCLYLTGGEFNGGGNPHDRNGSHLKVDGHLGGKTVEAASHAIGRLQIRLKRRSFYVDVSNPSPVLVGYVCAENVRMLAANKAA